MYKRGGGLVFFFVGSGFGRVRGRSTTLRTRGKSPEVKKPRTKSRSKMRARDAKGNIRGYILKTLQNTSPRHNKMVLGTPPINLSLLNHETGKEDFMWGGGQADQEWEGGKKSKRSAPDREKSIARSKQGNHRRKLGTPGSPRKCCSEAPYSKTGMGEIARGVFFLLSLRFDRRNCGQKRKTKKKGGAQEGNRGGRDQL